MVAATNRELESEVAAGRFRQDLYYRLNVHIIRVPPLRDHPSGVRKRRIPGKTLERLTAYDWRRNNVRELKNIIERMIIACDGDTIGVDQVPAEVRGGAGPESGEPAGTFHEQKIEAERRIILAALDRNDWHITRTASALGLADHASLLKIMRRHQLKQR